MTARNMGKKILTDAGYEVIDVSNGAAAVKKIAEHHPDLIILDVYMPGYTGLEVCERVKGESAHTPVLLTVGKMEPFKAEEGNRVRADGVIIKPFEASDLLAAIKRISQKEEPAPAAPPAFEDTVKMQALPEFEDASYQEWKTSTAEIPAPTPDLSGEDTRPPVMEVPQEMAVAPAMGMDDMFGEPKASAAAAGVEAASAPMVGFEVSAPPPPVGDFGFPSAAAPEPAPTHAFSYNPPSVELPETQPIEPIEEEKPVEAFGIVAEEAEVAAAHELEPTVRPAEAIPEVPAEPALVTDAEGMAEFTTKFGVQNPEVIPVGVYEAPAEEAMPVAEVVPETAPETATPLMDDFEKRVAAAMAAYEVAPADTVPTVTVPPMPEPEPEPEPVAEAVPEIAEVTDEERRQLEQEMQAAMAEIAPEAAPALAPAETVQIPVPGPETLFAEPEPVAQEAPAPARTQLVDQELVAGLAAAVSDMPMAEAEPTEYRPKTEPIPLAAEPAVASHEAVAQAVARVIERMKPDLVAAILKELESGK